MCRSCIYCERALVTPATIFSKPDIECMARNDLYVIHPILRALTCRGFKSRYRLQRRDISGKGQDQARKDS